MTISERMFNLLEAKSLKSVDLASILGVGTGQISTWKKRNTDPPSKYIAQICEFLDISCEYLLTGKEGNNDSIPQEDIEWLNLIHSLPRDAQLEFKGEMKGYLRRMRQEDPSDNELKQAK